MADQRPFYTIVDSSIVSYAHSGGVDQSTIWSYKCQNPQI